MEKLGPVNALYPMPTTLVGVMVNGKPNFIAIAHVGIMNHGTPQYISLEMNKAHYTNTGIRENETFSVCLPSEDLIAETDFCGLVCGKKTDKIDITMLKPLLFDMGSVAYYAVGKKLEGAWQIGKQMKKQVQ